MRLRSAGGRYRVHPIGVVEVEIAGMGEAEKCSKAHSELPAAVQRRNIAGKRCVGDALEARFRKQS